MLSVGGWQDEWAKFQSHVCGSVWAQNVTCGCDESFCLSVQRLEFNFWTCQPVYYLAARFHRWNLSDPAACARLWTERTPSKQNQPGSKDDALAKRMSLTGHWVPQSCRPPHGLVLQLTVHQAKAGTLSTGQWASVLPVGQPCHHCNYPVGCCLCLCLSLYPPQTRRDGGECGSALGSWFKSREILPTPSPFFPRQGNHSGGLWGNRSHPVRQYSHPSTWFHYPFPPASAWLCSSQICALKDCLSKFDYRVWETSL